MPKCNGRSREALRFSFTPMSHGLHIRIDNDDDPEFWCEIDMSLIDLLAYASKSKQLQIADEAEVTDRIIRRQKEVQ